MPWSIIAQLAAYIQTAQRDQQRIAMGQWRFRHACTVLNALLDVAAKETAPTDGSAAIKRLFAAWQWT
jgi:hypothetical protein